MVFRAIEGRASGRIWRAAALVAALILSLLTGVHLPQAQAEQESPYRVSESPIRLAPRSQLNAAVAGKYAIWSEEGSATLIQGRNLDTGLDFTIRLTGYVQGPPDIHGDMVVVREWSPEQGYGVFGYRLPEGQRFTISPFKSGGGFMRGEPRTDGQLVVWAEGTFDDTNIIAYDLTAQRLITVTTNPSAQGYPVVSDNFVVWSDSRNALPNLSYQDVYGYDIAGNQEFRISSQAAYISSPAISGKIVVWFAQGEQADYILGYDLAGRQQFEIARLPKLGGIRSVDVDGDLVVWNARGDLDDDIFGFDLKLGKQFIISRAIGGQSYPRISGKTVVWVDTRGSGVGKYEYDSDIYGAKLEPGPAPVPPVIGAPSTADAKIEIVWPHGGKPVAEADKANIGAWLFSPDTLKLTPCQWRPQVQLWKSVNNEPASLIANSGLMSGNHYYVGGRAVPTWEYNDVDVSAASDPNNRIFFFTTIDGTPGRNNVWAHAADARTFFPKQDTPSWVAPVTDTVDAKIEIVWPHNNAPVDQATKVNLSASLFSPDTLLSVPADWNKTVRLYRSLNNEVGREVATGQKRLVQAGSFTYPVWDFNDVDVSAATDPVNKYYFSLRVDGVTTHTNVWAHGADARTYFPQLDTPTQSCGSG